MSKVYCNQAEVCCVSVVSIVLLKALEEKPYSHQVILKILKGIHLILCR